MFSFFWFIHHAAVHMRMMAVMNAGPNEWTPSMDEMLSVTSAVAMLRHRLMVGGNAARAEKYDSCRSSSSQTTQDIACDKQNGQTWMRGVG